MVLCYGKHTRHVVLAIGVKIASRVENIKPNSTPFSLFNIYAIRMQWALVLQLKSTTFHNINVDPSELVSRVSPLMIFNCDFHLICQV
ncbi:hypothetical protein SFRURICE_008718 [Spodoptera frugiperda]|nr:hypothetical protein SFRURICE_008718 [Spodoptera frugiperda]